VQPGDVLGLYVAPDTLAAWRTPANGAAPQPIPVAAPLPPIIYEDTHVLVVNKPAGLACQGGMKEPDHLLARAAYYLAQEGAASGFSPALCHRLDVNTSGIVVLAKTPAAAQHWAALFSQKSQGLRKEYLAVVQGHPPAEGCLEGYLVKDPVRNISRVVQAAPGGKWAVTQFTTLAYNGTHTLLRVQPLTGRSHQIRAQLAHAGFPLAGDAKYGGAPTPFAPAQLLHAHLLHSPPTRWEAPPPQGLARCLQQWFAWG